MMEQSEKEKFGEEKEIWKKSETKVNVFMQ